MTKKLQFGITGLAITASMLGASAVHAGSVNDDYIVPASSVPRQGECHTDILFKREGNSNIPVGRPASSVVTGLPGYETADTLKKIYNIPSDLTGGGAIAIVDAYDNPYILYDFNTYSRAGGYPLERSPERLSKRNTVLQVVYATGKYPGISPYGPLTWDAEECLDVEIAHATAPKAKIYLVECKSQKLKDLIQGVEVAETLPGVKEISCSWGFSETQKTDIYDSAFATNGITVFASTGDSGAFSPGYPAFSPNVVAVGGTTIQRYLGKFVGEIGWANGGGGISILEAKPAFQNGVNPNGKFRTIPDISADADVNSGVAIVDSLYPRYGVWFDIGGTSLSAPFVAGLANLAASNRTNSIDENTALYSALGTNKLRDITIGLNGFGSNQGYGAAPGYDLVTGVGVPNGLGAF